MKRLLPLLGVAALLVAAPAFAQYVFLDTDSTGTCTSSDVLTSANTAVDIWYDSSHNANGSTATCPQDGSATMSFNSYQIILHAAGSGSVTYNAFTDFTGFDLHLGPTGLGGSTDFVNAFVSTSGVGLSPGLHKAGRVFITVTGTPTLSIATSTSLLPGANTALSSDCLGSSFDNSLKLGVDFTDACGTASPTPTKVTTWGAIKNLYK